MNEKGFRDTPCRVYLISNLKPIEFQTLLPTQYSDGKNETIQEFFEKHFEQFKISCDELDKKWVEIYLKKKGYEI